MCDWQCVHPHTPATPLIFYCMVQQNPKYGVHHLSYLLLLRSLWIKTTKGKHPLLPDRALQQTPAKYTHAVESHIKIHLRNMYNSWVKNSTHLKKWLHASFSNFSYWRLCWSTEFAETAMKLHLPHEFNLPGHLVTYFVYLCIEQAILPPVFSAVIKKFNHIWEESSPDLQSFWTLWRITDQDCNNLQNLCKTVHE